VDSTDRPNGQISLSNGSARQCDFCHRELSEGFLFCPFCGKRISLHNGPQRKWYHSRYAVAFALATLGPFALPLVWSNPRYTVVKKAVITVLTLALTALLVYLLVLVCIQLVQQVRDLMSIY
jgi:hypothetical protein